MEKQNWIEEVLNSTNGMRQATPDESLFLKVQNRIRNRETVPAKWLWTAAASFLLLLALNFTMLNSKIEKPEDAAGMIASGISRTNQLY
ncbi:hypothetical protein [Flavobacterium sp. 3HN19-14]|uniref:hypothetical protein n=1 Tax=Flavobacterium sp. 3HN19-14 TaxID=3448133 RepID=UPI003EE06945